MHFKLKLHFFFSKPCFSREREKHDRDREGVGWFEKKEDKACFLVGSHTLLENKAGAVTTPILCFEGGRV